MKSIIIKPEQLIVPGEYEIGNPAILQIYFRSFDKGQGEGMPPVIVAHKNTIDMLLDNSTLEKKNINYLYHIDFFEKFNERINKAYEKGANYFLLDGNHRSLAAALTHNLLNALELQTDEDMETGKEMVERGELFNWTIPGKTLDKSMDELKYQLKIYFENQKRVPGSGELNFNNTPLTVRERADLLVSNGELPQYMKERYHQEK